MSDAQAVVEPHRTGSVIGGGRRCWGVRGMSPDRGVESCLITWTNQGSFLRLKLVPATRAWGRSARDATRRLPDLLQRLSTNYDDQLQARVVRSTFVPDTGREQDTLEQSRCQYVSMILLNFHCHRCRILSPRLERHPYKYAHTESQRYLLPLSSPHPEDPSIAPARMYTDEMLLRFMSSQIYTL